MATPLNGLADKEDLDKTMKFIACGKVLGCKPQFVEFHLRDMYHKITKCNEILNAD